MGTRSDIHSEIINQKNNTQDIVRRKYLQNLYKLTGNDTILYITSFQAPQGAIQISLDDIRGFMSSLNGLKGKKLDLIIHSPGGSLEAAEQIVQYLRAKYDYIRAIIPQNAMSAATMIACACDEIIMGKQSAIGPIDPQMSLPTPNGYPMPIPAHAILEDFRKAEHEIISNPAVAPVWIPKLMSIPHGFLTLCEETIELAKQKVELWLDSYMFKNSPEKNGKKISEFLGDFSKHKTHGRPINYDIAKQIGLNVKRLEDCQALQDAVLSVYHAAMITTEITNCVKIIENHDGKGHFVNINFPQ